MSTSILQGLRILDLTRLFPGPVATWHLASMGASVIKVEDTGAGDYAKEFFKTAEESEKGLDSAFYRAINNNKEVIYLDLKNPDDQTRFLELVKQADLLIESFRPGVMDKLGFSYASLKQIKPSLVYCSITGFGATGSWKHKAAHDLNSIAMTGVLHQLSDANNQPIMPNLQIADLLGGAASAAMGCLAALWKAQRTGEGSFVDVSMTDGTLAHNLTAQVGYHAHGDAPLAKEDLLNGGVPCYNVYETKDGRWLAVGSLELKFWETFCETVEHPEWKKSHWALGQAVGSPPALELIQKVSQVVRQKTLAQWTEIFATVDCCVTPVLTLAEAMTHPLFIERGVVKADANQARWLQSPVRFS